MHEDYQDLEYPYPEISIKQVYLKVVDRVLVAALGRMWKCMHDITPRDLQNWKTLSYAPEELRTSRLGQSLLTIADYAGGGYVLPSKVELAMKQVYRMLFGNSLTNRYTLPSDIHKTELGQFLNEAKLRMYGPKELMTPKQAYTTLGISRQSLYDRADEGKLQKIYLPGGELRFLHVEIEEWKIQREQRQNRSKP